MGEGPPVLFVHGLGGSGRYWGTAFDALGVSRRLTFVDLAGFGGSRRVPGPYGIDGQVERLRQFVEELPAEPSTPLVLVAHSFGAVVGFAAAARWARVSGVVAFGLPAFGSPEQARRRLGALGVTERLMAAGSTWARAGCWALCHTRPLARALAPRLAPGVPRDVARDGVEHTWASARQTFDSLVHEANLPTWARAGTARRLVVQGADDPIASPDDVRRVLADAPVELRVLTGDHHLPIRAPEACLSIVSDFLDETGIQRPSPRS